TYLEFGGANVPPIVVTSDTGGEAFFDPLVPGAYRLTITGIDDSEHLDVGPGAAVIWKDPGCYDPASVGSVSGRICNPLDGAPVADVPLKLVVQDEPDRERTTDANGRFRFDGVTPGTHTLTISPPLQIPTDLTVSVTAGETTTIPSACTAADTGSISGIACDPLAGTPLSGLNVQLDVSGEPSRHVATNSGGFYRFIDVPAGTHTLTIPFPSSEPKVVTVTVVVSEESSVPSPECNPSSFGTVTGRICNPADQNPVADVPVDIDVTGESAPRSTTTDSDGRFGFDMVPPGDHQVTVRPPMQTPVSVNVTVTAGQETQIPTPTCGSGPIPDPATLTGTTCVGITSFHALAGATIEVDFNPGIVQTMSGTDGTYSISNLAAGNADVTISRGSWSTTFPVTLVENQTLDLGMTDCVGPGTRVAVVTGPDDDLVSPFTDLGLPVRQDASGAIVNPSGVVDVIDGGDAGDASSSDEWVDSFFANLSLLQSYDMIFLSSGLKLVRLFETDAPIACGLPPSNTPECAGMPGVVALENLEAYLNGGGAVYVSDWAYDIVRRQFPQYINFYANDFMAKKALCGAAPNNANALVLDENLALVLGGANVTIVYENLFAFWAVVETATSQPNSYFKPFLIADVPVYQYRQVTDATCDSTLVTILANSPLIAATPVGSNGGRVIFSSFRYLAAGDNAAIIQQILLEL
ncbi:MAG: carboxypeptidase regulatory-like domain-containing protein, partial [Myxococcota bacterium]